MDAIVVNLYGFYIAKIWMWTGCKRGLKQQLKPAEHKANNCQTCCECCDDLMPDWAGLVWPGLATSNLQLIAAAQKPQIGPDAAADGGYCRTTAGPQTGPGMTHAGNHNVTATATASTQADRQQMVHANLWHATKRTHTHTSLASIPRNRFLSSSFFYLFHSFFTTWRSCFLCDQRRQNI